jgi:hypothetical protein
LPKQLVYGAHHYLNGMMALLGAFHMLCCLRNCCRNRAWTRWACQVWRQRFELTPQAVPGLCHLTLRAPPRRGLLHLCSSHLVSASVAQQ